MTARIIVQRGFTLEGIDEVLNDYDDSLAATERIAFAACCGVVNAMLASKGLKRQYTPESLLAGFVGQSFRNMALSLAADGPLIPQSHQEEQSVGAKRRKQPLFTFESGELDRLVREEEDAVIAALGTELRPAPGANEFLASAQGQIGLSVVSSSAGRRLEACLKATGQNRYIHPSRVFSAATSLPTPCSKPKPDIYLYAMQQIGATPRRCLAIEDSVTGLRAALAAGIRCLGYTGCLPEAKREERTALLLNEGAIGVFEHWGALQLAVA